MLQGVGDGKRRQQEVRRRRRVGKGGIHEKTKRGKMARKKDIGCMGCKIK